MGLRVKVQLNWTGQTERILGARVSASMRGNPSYADRIIWRGIRKAWQGVHGAEKKLDTTSFNLTTARPAIPKENILLIEGTQDLVTPAEPIEELWQQWGQPDIWRFPHGHISLSLCLAGLPGLTGRVLRWLAPRLDMPGARTNQPTALLDARSPKG